MRLHNSNSYLTAQPEGKAKDRFAPKVTRFLYIAFIVFILLYVAYFFIARAWYVTAPGVIEVNKVALKSNFGGQVEYIKQGKGESFKKGDVLAKISPAKYCVASRANPRIQTTVFNIEDANIELQGLQKELKMLKQQHNSIETINGVRRALELTASLTVKKDDFSADIQKKAHQIEMQRLEIASLEERLVLLQQQPVTQLNDPSCQGQNISAPFDGSVYSVNTNQNESVRINDTLLTVISHQADVSIEMYLDADDFDAVSQGEQFEVTLPNGQVTQGTVVSITSAAIAKPEVIRNQYRQEMPGVLVYIAPVDEKAAQLWKMFDRFQVSIKGVK